MQLSKCAQGRENNFNLIRLIAAVAVLYSHSFALVTGSDKVEPLRQSLGMTLGAIAVDVFFVTSGFLVTASLLTKQNARDFIWSRLLRIYPALIVMVILAVFLVGMSFTTLPAADFLSSHQTKKFVLKNTTLLFGVAYGLPGVFEGIPWKGVINGSLWTMPVETRMYAILVGIWLGLSLFGANRVKACAGAILAVAAAALALRFADRLYLHTGDDFLRLFYMFFSGAACYVLKDKLFLSRPHFLLLLIGVLASGLDREMFFIYYNLSLPYLLLWVAYVPGGAIRKFNRLGDYSYGVYIYAFPIQQSLMALFPGISIAWMVGASAAATLTMAALSWHLIEKRALALKNKLADGSGRVLEGA